MTLWFSLQTLEYDDAKRKMADFMPVGDASR